MSINLPDELCLSSFQDFLETYDTYVTTISTQAGLIPDISGDQVFRAWDRSKRDEKIVYDDFIDDESRRLSHFKQAGIFLHHLSRLQPVTRFEGVSLTGVDEMQRQILLQFPTEFSSLMFVYEHLRAVEIRRKDRMFKPRALKKKFIKDICVFLSEGNHNGMGLYLLVNSLFLPSAITLTETAKTDPVP